MNLITQRLAALGLLALAVAIVSGLTVMPLTIAYVDRKTELDIVRERYADLVARRKDPLSLRNRLKALIEDVTASGLLVASSDEEASRLAEQQIRAVLDSQQIPLTNWSVLPGGEVRNLHAFRADLAFVIPTSRVPAILSAFENSNSAVFFEKISIRKQSLGFVPPVGRAQELSEISGTVRLLFIAPDTLTRARS